jgi:hypothetical protein
MCDNGHEGGVPPNKGMKLTSVERIGRSQLIPSVGPTMRRSARSVVIILKTLAALGAAICIAACGDRERAAAAHPNPGATPAERPSYPPAVDPARVGTYPALAKSGAGYFYDEVLEYRVWVHHPEGGDDTMQAFATYEKALRYSQALPGAEEPLVLVRQRESINEPSPGVFLHDRSERITEWRVEWLAGNQRHPDSIERFLKKPRAAQQGHEADQR